MILTNDAKWELQFAQLQAYKDKHGDCNVPRLNQSRKTGGQSMYKSLGVWVNTQRSSRQTMTEAGSKYRQTMTVERKAKLDSIGFDWRSPKMAPDGETRIDPDLKTSMYYGEVPSPPVRVSAERTKLASCYGFDNHFSGYRSLVGSKRRMVYKHEFRAKQTFSVRESKPPKQSRRNESRTLQGQFFPMCDLCVGFVRARRTVSSETRHRSIDAAEAINAPYLDDCHYQLTVTKELADELVLELMQRPGAQEMLSAMESAPIRSDRPVVLYAALSRFTRGPEFPRDELHQSNALNQSHGCELEAVQALLKGRTALKMSGSDCEGPTRDWLEKQLEEGTWKVLQVTDLINGCRDAPVIEQAVKDYIRGRFEDQHLWVRKPECCCLRNTIYA
jgi:hypothetical protein